VPLLLSVPARSPTRKRIRTRTARAVRCLVRFSRTRTGAFRNFSSKKKKRRKKNNQHENTSSGVRRRVTLRQRNRSTARIRLIDRRRRVTRLKRIHKKTRACDYKRRWTNWDGVFAPRRFRR